MPIIRLTDKEEMRNRILAARDEGDPRWQQKWDDLDAFPYDDTDQHQAEFLAGRPALARLLAETEAAREAIAARMAEPQQAAPVKKPSIFSGVRTPTVAPQQGAFTNQPNTPNTPAPRPQRVPTVNPSPGMFTPSNPNQPQPYLPPPPSRGLAELGLDKWLKKR